METDPHRWIAALRRSHDDLASTVESLKPDAKSQFRRMALRELGISGGEFEFDPDNLPFGTEDELVSTVVEVSAFVDQKRAALVAHASQISENFFFLQLPPDVLNLVFGTESFVRHLDTTGAPTPEDDLFAGLR